MADEEKLVLLTAKQLAKLTGLAYWRVLQLVAAGKAPPHMRVGNTLRFPQDAAVGWIREQSTNHKER
jgi:predicted DNA-binding transcriptional regulator AlpA